MSERIDVVSRVWIPKNFEEVCKRVAGRRRYHSERRQQRDQRQLVIMGILIRLDWPRYGYGRALAELLSVDPATISRDLKYIREWRASLLEDGKMSPQFADAIILRLVVARIHPRSGYSWTYQYAQGASSLIVKRCSPCYSASSFVSNA
jgi:hypothetical protein